MARKARNQDISSIVNILEKLPPSKMLEAVSQTTLRLETPCCKTYFSNDKEQCAVVYCECEKFCFYCLKVLHNPDNNRFEEDDPHQHIRYCIKNPKHGHLFPGYGDERVRGYIAFEENEAKKALKRLGDVFTESAAPDEQQPLRDAIHKQMKSIKEYSKAEATKYGLPPEDDDVIVLDE